MKLVFQPLSARVYVSLPEGNSTFLGPEQIMEPPSEGDRWTLLQAGQEGRGGIGTEHPKTRNLLVLGSAHGLMGWGKLEDFRVWHGGTQEENGRFHRLEPFM